MRLITLLLITLYCVSLTACSSPKPSVVDADPAGVKTCTFLTSVTGTSPFGGLMAEYGMNEAKDAARQLALKSGATHLVWYSVSGGNTSVAGAHAYKCTK